MVETLKKEFVKEEGQELRVAAAIFNVSGGFVRKPFLELTPEEWERGWDGSVRTSFNFAQLLLPHLLVHRDTLASSSGSDNHDQHPPTLLFTGATASFKGSANFAAFASPKFGLRATAQSLAREYGPKGVHVAHIVVDGVIDIPRTHGWDMGPEGKIDPNAVRQYIYFPFICSFALSVQSASCCLYKLSLLSGQRNGNKGPFSRLEGGPFR